MTDVIVASANPAKIKAVRTAFEQLFPDRTVNVSGIAVNSEVSAQPLTSDETLQGALNRVNGAYQLKPGASFYVGIEAGLDESYTFAWIVIRSGTKVSKSRSASFMLPPAVLTGIAEGKELGDIMDSLFQQENIKHKSGAIGLLTAGQLSRSEVYHQALILAMIPMLNPALYN